MMANQILGSTTLSVKRTADEWKQGLGRRQTCLCEGHRCPGYDDDYDAGEQCADCATCAFQSVDHR